MTDDLRLNSSRRSFLDNAGTEGYNCVPTRKREGSGEAFHLEPTYFEANLYRPTYYILSFWSCLLKLNRPSRFKYAARRSPGGFFG